MPTCSDVVLSDSRERVRDRKRRAQEPCLFIWPTQNHGNPLRLSLTTELCEILGNYFGRLYFIAQK